MESAKKQNRSGDAAFKSKAKEYKHIIQRKAFKHTGDI